MLTDKISNDTCIYICVGKIIISVHKKIQNVLDQIHSFRLQLGKSPCIMISLRRQSNMKGMKTDHEAIGYIVITEYTST